MRLESFSKALIESSLLAAALCCAWPAIAQSPAAAAAPPAKIKPAAQSIYVHGVSLDFASLVPPPPDAGSAADQADLAEVHRVEAARTPAEVKAAQADDLNENIFLYADVLGPGFRADRLPLTAALSEHLRHESSVVNPALKLRFARPRPYIADKTLHLVCEPSKADSYPSGHAMVGYLLGFALTQMVPERSAAILLRARQYARNRIVCGAHYPTDIEASHTIALALFGTIAASPAFQAELTAARAELQKSLSQPPATR